MKKLLLKALSKFTQDKRAFQYRGPTCIKCGKQLKSEKSKADRMGRACRRKSEAFDAVVSNVGMEDIHASIR